jgi:hypothetical protein
VPLTTPQRWGVLKDTTQIVKDTTLFAKDTTPHVTVSGYHFKNDEPEQVS